MEREEAIKELRGAWCDRQLTLYLGAGVSVATGLPTWERLVVAMYFDAISRTKMPGWRPFPNYLYAIAEHHVRRMTEPLEITARRLWSFYPDPREFLERLRHTLYPALYENTGHLPNPADLRAGNQTLDAIATLCESTGDNGRIHAVISYNYDNLVEHALNVGPARRCAPVWNSDPLPENTLPIYHVHGYVPPEGDGSDGRQIVFTEDQYHLAAADPYAWPSIVQLHCLSGSTGLMVGLSLSDRNMRRLLDAVMRTPGRSRNFALLKRPDRSLPDDQTVDEIDRSAKKYVDRFLQSGVKSRSMGSSDAGWGELTGEAAKYMPMEKGPRYRSEIRGILAAVEEIDDERRTQVFEQLGIHPIWYDSHEEIPGILDQIHRPS